MKSEQIQEMLQQINLNYHQAILRTQQNLEAEALAKAQKAQFEAEHARLDLEAKRRCYEDHQVIPKQN